MDGIERIELAGRTCYKSEDKITDGSAQSFARMLIKRGHEAMLEHASATVKFITNRGVTHELVRHRVASFGQESTRFVNYGGDDIAFIRPVWCSESVVGIYGEGDFWPGEDEATDEFVRSCLSAETFYKAMLGYGWQPQQAREVLPNSLKTEIVVTANFREWRHIFKLRAVGVTGKPHPQMQALMLPVLREFAERCPAVFGDIYDMLPERV
ncbi:MAG: FAD-dependent thymidylate synthase [Desulfovibrionaceae bacterium]